MSHLVETMAYAHKQGSNESAYQVPWHGLGVPVSNNLTPEEMLKAAQLDWTVQRHPTMVLLNDQYVATGKDVLVRSSDNRILTHITENWNEVQNFEAFDLFSEWIKAGHMEMNSAGSLKNGSVVWALAKCKESFSLFRGRDEVDLYLLFTNPHVYGQCIDIRATPIRVVCNNTLTLALNEKEKKKKRVQIKLNHTQKFDAEYVKKTLALASQKMGEYKEQAEFISSRKFTVDDLISYYNTIFPKVSEKEEVSNEISLETISRTAREVYDMLDEQPGHNFGAGTWWSAYNSVTYALDHRIGRSVDTRLHSAWYGPSRQKKELALIEAVKMAKVSEAA